MDRLVAKHIGQELLLDNTEILFNRALKQDPLRLLQHLSRNRSVIATWLGVYKSQHLENVVPSHPEHRDHANPDVRIVTSEDRTSS